MSSPSSSRIPSVAPVGLSHRSGDSASSETKAHELNGRSVNNPARRVPSRKAYVPDPMAEVRARYLAPANRDSTKVKVLKTGEKLVVFGRDEKRRRPSPPWKLAASEEEAQELVKAHLALATTGIRQKPGGGEK